MHKLMVSGIVALVTGLSNAQAMTATSPVGLVAPMQNPIQYIQYTVNTARPCGGADHTATAVGGTSVTFLPRAVGYV